MEFGIGVINQQWPDGTDAEGKGVEPDIPLSLIQKELLAGEDHVLKQAITYIENTMEASHHAH